VCSSDLIRFLITRLSKNARPPMNSKADRESTGFKKMRNPTRPTATITSEARDNADWITAQSCESEVVRLPMSTDVFAERKNAYDRWRYRESRARPKSA